MARRGETFERSVFEYCKSLDPAAQVIFDHKVPDRDTGALRQADVWINCKLLGQHPVSVLVSCKDHARPLDVSEIETFLAEIRSTGAGFGILYARAGFTQNALRKARAHGIACCRLFDNAPPERPSELLMRAFLAHPLYVLLVHTAHSRDLPRVRWCELPGVHVAGRTFAFSEVIALRCRDMLTASSEARNTDLQSGIDWPASDVSPPFRLEFAMFWQWYQGQLNAFSLAGSFDAVQQLFRGSTQVGPMPLSHVPSSEAWQLCERPNDSVDQLQLAVSALAAPAPAGVAAAMAGSSVFFGGPWRFGSAPQILQDSSLNMTMRFEHP